jgi:hypothetical protein
VIEATDGTIGHLEDLIMLDRRWRIHFLVIKTGIWFFGNSVTLPPTWIIDIDWVEQRIHVNLTQDSIRNAPEVDIDQLNATHMDALEKYYNSQTNGKNRGVTTPV